MKSGICPKCKSEEVYVDSNDHGFTLRIHMFSPHQTHTYVCSDCGFIELYAEKGHDLDKVKEKFRKVKGWLT